MPYPIAAVRGGKLYGAGVAAPAVPTSLVAVPASTSQINLTWTDNATTETGYKIYRSTDGVSYSLIDTIAANSNSYSDTTITAGVNYYYKVAAYIGVLESESNVDATNTLLLNLESYWRMTEDSGNRVDSIGSNHWIPSGSITSETGGILGNSTRATSAGTGYMAITDNNSISGGSSSFEFDGWFYIDSFTAGGEFFSKRGDYTIIASAANVTIVTWHGAATKIATKTVTINTGQWYYFSFTFDSAGQLSGIDINNSGTRVTVATTSGTMDNSSNNLNAFRRVDNPAFLVDGRLCQLGYWKGRVLTAAERTARYNGGAGFNSFLAL